MTNLTGIPVNFNEVQLKSIQREQFKIFFHRNIIYFYSGESNVKGDLYLQLVFIRKNSGHLAQFFKHTIRVLFMLFAMVVFMKSKAIKVHFKTEKLDFFYLNGFMNVVLAQGYIFINIEI